MELQKKKNILPFFFLIHNLCDITKQSLSLSLSFQKSELMRF